MDVNTGKREWVSDLRSLLYAFAVKGGLNVERRAT